MTAPTAQSLSVDTRVGVLAADVAVPDAARAAVVTVRGSHGDVGGRVHGELVRSLTDAGYATVSTTLLTDQERESDQRAAEVSFDVPLLSRRMLGLLQWVDGHRELGTLPVGVVASATPCGAGIVSATARPELVRTVVCVDGRPDLAGHALTDVRVPVLCIVGDADAGLVDANQRIAERVGGDSDVRVVADSGRHFDRAPALETVIGHTVGWLAEHLG